MSTLTSNGNDALWSFEIIWSVISEQSPYWAVANEMHAGNVRTALELPREELQKAVGVLVKGRLRDLLIQARPYIESFASLSKHPTAPDDARNLVWQINEAIRSTHEVTAHETPELFAAIDDILGSAIPSSAQANSVLVRRELIGRLAQIRHREANTQKAVDVPAKDLCAVCEGVFIDHRHGAMGHDWRPKPQSEGEDRG